MGPSLESISGWKSAVSTVPDDVQVVAVESFGVTVEVTADAAHMPAVGELLPPGARAAHLRPERGRFELLMADSGLFRVLRDRGVLAKARELPAALNFLDSQIRMHIALHAQAYVFVHAGVVVLSDRAIVLPGRSYAGKTTLVVALVKAGADYWSDEYAVLDACGRVHPYPRRLSMRIAGTGTTEERTIESLGGRAGDRPVEVGLVALTQYRSGASWAPRRCTPGEGAVRLLGNTMPARTRPEQSLDAVRRAASDALVLDGERGEASETAAALISALTQAGVRP
jgi:hypothetical protein